MSARKMKFLFFLTSMLCVGVTNAQRLIVTLDNYFNSEWKKDSTGKMIPFHYTWSDKENTGFSQFGDLFGRQKVEKNTLTTAPTKENLTSTSIYIIVDPDTEKETAHPNYIMQKDIGEIAAWVKQGGVLLLMGNDSANAEFQHFNQLAATFGIHFDQNTKNHVEGDNFEEGAITIPVGDPIFRTARKVFLKDVSTVTVKKPAKIALKNGSDNIIAISKYGKGTVFAVGDPWLYNEYIDNSKLPREFENYAAANDLIRWLVRQVHH